MILIPVQYGREGLFRSEPAPIFTVEVSSPRLFAASAIPFIDTPSVVAWHRESRKRKEYSMPKWRHTMERAATPHCMESFFV